MRRKALAVTVASIALAFVMITPATGWARAELADLGADVCCLDLDLRVTVGVDGGRLRSTLEFAGREFACVTLGPKDAVRWGVPIVMIVAEFRSARTNLLVPSSGNTGVR
jgi:hypothetical protein